MPSPLRGVYLITPDLADTPQLLDRTRAALAGGVALLQYRNKRAEPSLRREQASALARVCDQYRVPLIINDDVDLALCAGAAGVHLGGEDGSLRDARARMGPDALIGASCYQSLDRARRARDEGASYLAFGAFGASPTKPAAARAEASLLIEARRFTLPIVAIGGVTPDLARELVASGADLVAVISAVYDAAEPAAAVAALRQAFPEFQGDPDEHQPRAV